MTSHNQLYRLVFFTVVIISIGLIYIFSSSHELSTIQRNVSTIPHLEPSLPFHPFQAKCRFPISNAYADDVMDFTFSQRLRRLKCNVTNNPLASLDSEGYLYIHPSTYLNKHRSLSFECTVDIVIGGLRDFTEHRWSSVIWGVNKTLKAPIHKRLYVNTNVFIVECFDEVTNFTWSSPFTSFIKPHLPLDEITVAEDTSSIDKFGRIKRKKEDKKKKMDRYSIDILAIESMSRTMFLRHMPRTVDTMVSMGFHFVYGYNKVGDNSVINMAPILAGDLKETMEEEKFDSTGDIRHEWILPCNRSIDPDTIPFLWKTMKSKYNCTTMFNDDVGAIERGHYHYPHTTFKAGFTSKPTDNYFRAFYAFVYGKWKRSPCENGDQLQKDFIEIWYRFKHVYKDVCHFGFSFISSLTHDDGFYVELLDEFLAHRLESLHSKGLLKDSLNIIQGDHGNRVNGLVWTFHGRIEQQMPLMAIRFPDDFKSKYPQAYKNFRENQYKLTSNFDIHQTLKDFVDMDFRENKTRVGRGISLFQPIPANRTCHDAYISNIFCTCLQSVNHLKPVRNPAMSTKWLPEKLLKRNCVRAISEWIRTNNLGNCLNASKISVYKKKVETLSVNNLLLFRSLPNKIDYNEYLNATRRQHQIKTVIHEVPVRLKMLNDKNVELLFRIEENIYLKTFEVVFEPMVLSKLSYCSFYSLFDVCYCLFSDN